MQSIKQVATAHGVSDRTVRNWLVAARKDGKSLGIMRSGKLFFAADEVFQLSSYGRQPDEHEVVEPEFVDDFESQMVVHRPSAGGLVPINIQNLTINITQANTALLERETVHYQGVNAAGLNAIGEYIQADLNTTVHHVVAQNRHAVAGLAAQASVSLANSLGKPQGDTDSTLNG